MTSTSNYNVFFFGDSITWGMSDSEGGWARRLSCQFNDISSTTPDLNIIDYNMGIPGNTAEDLVNRFEKELQPRLMQGWHNIAVFAIGTNDSQYHLPSKTPRYADDIFKSYLVRLITEARRLKINDIAFVGLMPVDEKQTVPLLGFPDFATPQEQIFNKNKIIKAVCTEHNVTYIDIGCDFKNEQSYLPLLEDGMHPNTKGHELIEQKVSHFFEKYFDLNLQHKNHPSVKR